MVDRNGAHSAATAAYPDLYLLVDGQEIGSRERHCLPLADPSTGETIARVPMASREDVKNALAACQRAYPGWRAMGPVRRSSILRKAAELLRDRCEALASLITLELGKPTSEALREVEIACELFEWAAEEGRRAYGRVIPARSGNMKVITIVEPIGPAAAFSGWNAPAITPARKISSALASGCTLVFKPSEATAGSALRIGEALMEAGLPPGVLNIVFGNPEALAEQLLDSPIVRMFSFTGSTGIGKLLAARATRTMKRMVLELGGHAPVIVLEDADPQAVAMQAVAAKYRNSGQVCTSPTRFLVQDTIYSRFVECFAEAASRWRVGDPFDPTTQMGPLQNERRVLAMERIVEDARSRGARVIAGGRRIDRAGFFFEPTVIVDAPRSCLAMNEEPFGPIAIISAVDSPAQAVEQANCLPLGLAGYLFTNNMRSAEEIGRSIACGSLAINHWTASWPETPFGGVKDSGMGMEGGAEGLQAFQQTRTISQAA